MTVGLHSALDRKKGPGNNPEIPKCHFTAYTWGQQ